MKSYLQTLEEKAEAYDVPLLTAFKSADIPTSTYYRTINAQTELRYDTARKVMKNLEKLHALQEARKHTEQLRKSGARVDIRKTRARFKPRSIGA
jgi:predicted transcriptional regulator